uniref:RING-type domain-containing protein n=1 Tax=viral metagenome TaxID=1070528 RepID=A0A6C0KV08_9ZZZZ
MALRHGSLEAQRNSIEYANASWEEDSLPAISLDGAVPGIYRSTVTNILSKHCMEVKLVSEESVQTSAHISKKKLKDLIAKHNNEIFSFMENPEKSPNILGTAETIFRRYGHELPSIRGTNRTTMLKELHLNAEVDEALIEFNEGLKRNVESGGGMEDFVRQMRWLITQYKNKGEEVLRLETNLFQKIDMLDKVNSRLPMITSLAQNDELGNVIDAFSKYAENVYQTAHFEENYKDLIQAYKKWNVCRQLLSFQNVLRCDGAEPACSICLLDPISAAIVPCGHTFCGTCAKKQNTTCFICRGQIRERVKLYFT